MSLAINLLKGGAFASVAADNAVAYAVVPNVSANQRAYLAGFAASFSAAVSAVKTITVSTSPCNLNEALSTPALAAGSTDTKVANGWFTYLINGVAYQKAAVAAGTSLPSGTILADTWGAYRASISTAGTITFTAADGNTDGSYTTEALAIAGLPEAPSGESNMGYLTVLTASGQPFIAGTDALQGGSSGNPSDDTNYTSASATLTTVGAALRWDFTNGPLLPLSLPLPLHGTEGQSLVVSLAASGSGGTTGSVVAFGGVN